MTQMLEDFVWRMAPIVHLLMGTMILDHQFMILRKFRYESSYRSLSLQYAFDNTRFSRQ
jgi:hypothetical protein